LSATFGAWRPEGCVATVPDEGRCDIFLAWGGRNPVVSKIQILQLESGFVMTK